MLDVVGLLSLSDTCPDPLCTKLHKVQYCNYQFNIFIPEWNTARHFRETSILLNTSVKIQNTGISSFSFEDNINTEHWFSCIGLHL